MKNDNVFRLFVSTVALCVFAGTAERVMAQAQAPAKVQAAAQEGSSAPRRDMWRVEGGGIFIDHAQANGEPHREPAGLATLGNAIVVLTKLYPDVTFALAPGLEGEPVGDLVARVDDPTLALKALQVAAGDCFEFNEDNKLFTLRPSATFHHGEVSNKRSVECFNVAGYLDTVRVRHGRVMNSENTALAVNELKQVILETIAMINPPSARKEGLQFKYFSEGQMLIVMGPSDLLEIAEQVIHGLPGWNLQGTGGGGGGGGFSFAGGFGGGGAAASTHPGNVNNNGGGAANPSNNQVPEKPKP